MESVTRRLHGLDTAAQSANVSFVCGVIMATTFSFVMRKLLLCLVLVEEGGADLYEK